MPTLAERLKAEAHRRGFALVGIAPAVESDGFAHLQEWLKQGYAGEMEYLHRRAEERRHPRSILPNVRSVLMLGMEYRGGPREQVEPLDSEGRRGRVARYAQGPDYHPYLWSQLRELARWLQEASPGCAVRGVTDTAPLLERDFARRAGLGWFGKNTMLINPRRGSFFFLAALLTDLDLPPDRPFERNHCGSCTACLEACPTQAFPKPFVLDATRCISYLTIEHRSAIPEDLRPGLGNWLFGCDVCQEVCPWNRRAGPGHFPHHSELETINLLELFQLDEAGFRERFQATSLSRARRTGLLRNAAIVLGNVGDERALPVLEKAKETEGEIVREAATWAIGRIRDRLMKSRQPGDDSSRGTSGPGG